MGVYKLSASGGLKTGRTQYTSMLAGNAAYFNSEMELISTTLLAADTSSVTFSSIPNTYKHLQLRLIMRGTAAGSSAYAAMFTNGSSSTQNQHFVWGNGSSVQSGSNLNLTYANIGYIPSGGNTTNLYGAMIIDILDYASTSKYKTLRYFSGHSGSDYRVELRSSSWQDLTAINQLQFSPWDSPNFKSGSRFSLYGIKG